MRVKQIDFPQPGGYNKGGTERTGGASPAGRQAGRRPSMRHGIGGLMEKKLFLTGPAGGGKSRLLREALGGRLASAGGFVTERSLDADGRFVGYSLLPAAAAGGVAGFAPALYLDCRVFPPEKHHEVFRETGVRLLEEAAWYPFALLDELGGYELLIPQFAAALAALLSTPTPCVGALRTGEDAELLRSLLGLSDRYPRKLARLFEALSHSPDCRVVELTEANREEVRALLERWAAEYAPFPPEL